MKRQVLEHRRLVAVSEIHLFEADFWRGLQERQRQGEILSFYPYSEARRLRASDRIDEWILPPPVPS